MTFCGALHSMKPLVTTMACNKQVTLVVKWHELNNTKVVQKIKKIDKTNRPVDQRQR